MWDAGSGYIDMDELGVLLNRLRVPLPEAELVALHHRISADARGIDFAGFSRYAACWLLPCLCARALSFVLHRARWWASDFHSLRKVFLQYDTDGSGSIDMFEFASLLRDWGVSFSPHQFQLAMKQLARSMTLTDLDAAVRKQLWESARVRISGLSHA
jgi:Ca2+-binding EF-hand superfamily protein